jgi:hypothetical protein
MRICKILCNKFMYVSLGWGEVGGGGDDDGQGTECVMSLRFELHFQFNFKKPCLSDCYPIVNLIVMLTSVPSKTVVSSEYAM